MKKRGMKAIATLLCAAMTAVSLTACGQGGGGTAGTVQPASKESASVESVPTDTGGEQGGSAEAQTSAQDSSFGTKKIAYLTPGLDLPFWRYLANGIENKVIDTGLDATVQVYDSGNSSEKQLQNAQDAIAKGVDLIIISPTDSSSCPSVLSAAEDAGIPVVIADIGTDSGKYEAFVVTPNAEGSKELGDYVLKYMKDNGMGDKTAAQITGSLARNNVKSRFDGFNQALDEAGMKMEDYRQMDKYTRAEAEGYAQDLMTTYPSLGVIFCHMDEPTLGVVKAVQNADKQDSLVVCGFDGTPETVEAIKSGELLAAAIQQPALMGALSVEAAQKIFAGEEPEEQVDVPTLLVTKENCEDAEITKQLSENVFPDSKAAK